MESDIQSLFVIKLVSSPKIVIVFEASQRGNFSTNHRHRTCRYGFSNVETLALYFCVWPIFLAGIG